MKVRIIQLVFLKYVLDRTLIGNILYRKNCCTKGHLLREVNSILVPEMNNIWNNNKCHHFSFIFHSKFCQVPVSLLGLFNPYSA